MHHSRDIYACVMYYVYVTPGPSLLIESTDSMITKIKIVINLILHVSFISTVVDLSVCLD